MVDLQDSDASDSILSRSREGHLQKEAPLPRRRPHFLPSVPRDGP